MQVITSFSGLPAEAKGAVIALGNFDGVHRGHCFILEQARSTARQTSEKTPVAVLTLEPHPREVLFPEGPPFRLTLAKERADLLARCQIDYLFELPFTEALMKTAPATFVKDILLKSLQASALICGEDFAFGYKRTGNTALLTELATKASVAVHIPPFLADKTGEVISSSRIRQHIAAGEIQAANQLLGHSFFMTGPVEHGLKLGQKLGFRTANLNPGRRISPAYGVYAVYLERPNGDKLPAVANFGLRPTVLNNLSPLLEVHIFDFDRMIYDETVTVHFEHFLRPEEKFASFEALKEQIKLDAQQALLFFQQHS